MNFRIKHLILVGFIFGISLNLFGQQTERKFEKFEDAGNKIKLLVSDGIYEIVPFSDNIVHTTFFPKDKKVKEFSYATAVVPKKMKYLIKDTENQINISFGGLLMNITKNPFQITYQDNKEKVLISENKGYTELKTGSSIDFLISKDELLYGGGARVLGMNRRGNRLQLYNRAHYGYETHSELMNYTLPLFISSKKYSVLFDNSSSGFLDLDSKKNNTVGYEAVSGTMNYYIINGKDWFDLVDQYTWLTGRQPLPPRWAFGNFSSRFGYHSQKEVENIVEKFHKDSIPLDAVIIDIYWFGKDIQGHMGNLDWYRDSFPNPDKMIAKFKEQGIKTILVTEPFILTTSKKWNEVADKKLVGLDSLGNPYKYDFYFGNTGLVDLYKPEAREWFWNIYKGLTNQGIAGWWGDLGEPEVHPAALKHAVGTADEVHNAYGHEWAKLIFDGYQKDFPNSRTFILMRAGYAGSQRYGMIPWTGDVSRSWGGLVSQPEISLEMGMQGIAYMHSDLGGFAGGVVFDPELYTRWLQYGVFQPIYRPHAQEHIPAEPVLHDEKTKALAKSSIELRYRLIPYIYNMAFENNQTGKPLMIPLFFIEPENSKLLTYDQAYMWGDAFLVSPVKEKGKQTQSVYFPKGSTWYDFFEDGQFTGGNTFEINLKPWHIPVFVKGGSFIPMSLKAENTENYSLQKFELNYYTDPLVVISTYSLYNDDGKTSNAFEKANFEIMNFKAFNEPNSLVIQYDNAQFGKNFKRIENQIILKVHYLTKKPKSIKLKGKKLDQTEWKWDADKKILQLVLNCNIEKGIVEITK